MTLETFLEKLEQTPRGSWKCYHGRIRTHIKGCMTCPINAVAGVTGLYWEAAKFIGLPKELTDNIAESADNGPGMYGTFDADLRAKLLKACGLESA